MDMKKSNWLGSPVNNRKRKSNLISKRYSAACLSVCSTSWYASPGDLAAGEAGGFTTSAEYIKTKGSETEFGKLRKKREFGSTGDLLEGSAGLKNSFKHQHPLRKSMEHLPVVRVSSDASEVGPFRTETGADCSSGEICSQQPLVLHSHALLENPENETRWYFRYFLGKYHLNYLCYDTDKNPLFLSVVPSDSMYRCILWMKTGNKRLCVKHNSKGKWPSPKSILEKFLVRVERSFKEIVSPSIQKELLTLEEQEGSVNFKFGVIYAKAGQKTDNEMYCNEHGSERFHQFLELLGDEVQLSGWQHFKGGLDNKNDSTGLSSVYTVFEGHEVMFHVSTLLPYTTANEQQLERKRHIGNDIVVIIFVDYDTDPEDAYRSAIMDFDPSYMRSHFNHIFALVTYSDITENYRLVVHTAKSVPAFGPSLPLRGEFSDFVTFRDFLLAKLINGEKAAYCTPTFSHKRERTLGLLLKGVEKNYSQEMRRAVSTPALNHSPTTYKKFNEREKAFTELGQRLKVDKIITGLHPTSQRTTVSSKREPWETECVVEHFPYKISHGDICDGGIFLVNTPDAGTYFIYSDGSYSLILDQSISIGQLMVAHRHQLLLFRTNYSKDTNYLYAIPLKQFYNDSIKVASKSSLSRYQVPHSKGTSLFCSSPLGDQFLRLAVAVKNKVYMLAYKHPAAPLVHDGSPLTPMSSTDPKDNFIKHRELILMDTPLHMTLLDQRPSGKLCVTYQKLSVVDAIDEIMATTQRIPNLDIAKTKLTTLTSVQFSGESNQLLIGHNLISQLITLHENTAYNSMEIMWNTEPQAVVYLHPYMVAFTDHTVEIRMASNGSLMQTISVPDLHLISAKGDLYFTSSSCMVYTASCKTPTSARSFSNIPSKLPKHMDKRDLATSGKYNENEELTYIYKISLENMTGRRESNQVRGFENSVMTNSTVSKPEVVSILSDDDGSESPKHRLDYIHPMFGDEESPVIRRSFQEHVSPITFVTRRVQSARFNSPTHETTITEHEASTSPYSTLEAIPSRTLESGSPPPCMGTPPYHCTSPAPPQVIPHANSPRANSPRANSPCANSPHSKESPPHSKLSPLLSKQSPPHSKLRRARKVLTSRKSLDSGSRWLYPYFPDERFAGDSVHGGGGSQGTRGSAPPGRYRNDVQEILGMLENVVYSSPDSGMHDDLSLSSNSDDTSSREPHH